MQCPEGSVSGPFRFSNRGQDNFTELRAKNRIGPCSASKAPETRQKAESRLAQNAPRQLGLEAERLFLRDLVQLHGPLEVRAHAFHPG